MMPTQDLDSLLAELAATPHPEGRGLVVWQGPCREEWQDYNGHMNETFYLQVMSWGTDRLMELIGCGPAYREGGSGTLYTLESHIRYLTEVKIGTPLTVTAQIFERDAKRFRLYMRLYAGQAERPSATRSPSASSGAPRTPPRWTRTRAPPC